ncbi:MAG: glycosyltransferase family 2 protein [Chthoniobacterales bacterium]|nr:glycosyltransferase family 2 protein [Chthoniobacterales bacterium]
MSTFTPTDNSRSSECISIIIPFYNEEENVETVLQEARMTNPDAEIIAVNDGSRDATEALIKKFQDVRLISFSKNLGQSAALYAGLLNASHDLCVLMDGDGQNDPADIPMLIREAGNYQIVCGYRRQRQDSWQVKVASKIANKTRRFFTGDSVRDAGCTLKVIRKEYLPLLIPFNEMQCYMIAMLEHAGLTLGQFPVNHRPRRFGSSNYTILRRAWRGVWDLLGISWLLRRQICWPASDTYSMK